MMKVKVIKANLENWYSNSIGNEFEVTEKEKYYVTKNGRYILKSDCFKIGGIVSCGEKVINKKEYNPFIFPDPDLVKACNDNIKLVLEKIVLTNEIKKLKSEIEIKDSVIENLKLGNVGYSIGKSISDAINVANEIDKLEAPKLRKQYEELKESFIALEKVRCKIGNENTDLKHEINKLKTSLKVACDKVEELQKERDEYYNQLSETPYSCTKLERGVLDKLKNCKVEHLKFENMLLIRGNGCNNNCLTIFDYIRNK